jgi:hypothetical protein
LTRFEKRRSSVLTPERFSDYMKLSNTLRSVCVTMEKTLSWLMAVEPENVADRMQVYECIRYVFEIVGKSLAELSQGLSS